MMTRQHAIAGAVAGAFFAIASHAAVAQTVVKIGHVGPTTGAIAHLGKDNENGARMAVDELNDKKLKIGGKDVKFELLAEDDAADPKQGTAAAQKLVDAKVNGVVGHLNSGTTIPASRIYSEAGIPQVSPSSTNPKYTRQNFKTTFRVVANDGQLGGTLGRYAVKELKGKNVAIIDDRTAYGQGVADEFQKSVKEAGAKIVGREFTTDKSTDFGPILTKLKSANPDIVFFGGMDAVAGPMLRQLRQLGMDVKFMGGDGICTAKLAELAGDSMKDGQVVCAEAGGITKDLEPAMNEWRDRYKKKFGIDVQLYAPYVYDAVMVLVDSMKRADSVDPKKYLPQVGKTKYAGVTGPISFDQRGDMNGGTLTLFTYKGGKRETIAVVK